MVSLLSSRCSKSTLPRSDLAPSELVVRLVHMLSAAFVDGTEWSVKYFEIFILFALHNLASFRV